MSENLKDKFLALLNEEPKENPITDAQAAKKFSVLRETITYIRKSMNIPNSRERKRLNLQAFISELKTHRPDISMKQLMLAMKARGFNVSHAYLTECMAAEETDSLSEISDSGKEIEAEGVFGRLIGNDGSLSKNVTQGKAAILYPPMGLPTLIVGASGTGKTLFADYMYHYALQQQVLKEDAPFVLLNCADYSDNPQLLISILYGYKKGSFTGADKDTEGLVDKADHGMLFLDEIHRLPPKGQEMLFSILDKGCFRRMGETGLEHRVELYFIGATTENLESSLLLTFRRRIPMIIELPALEDRPLPEKIALIYGFFQEEANRTKTKIMVKAKILAAFAAKKYSGNIGQLKSEIQVTCANAYVEKINRKRDEIYIGFNEVLYQKFFADLQFAESRIVFKDKLFIPITEKMNIISAKPQSHYALPEDIYDMLSQKYATLKSMHIDVEEKQSIMWNFLLGYFDKIRTASNEKMLTSLDEMKYLLQEPLIQLLREFFQYLQKVYANRVLNQQVLLYLAIHLSEAVKRIRLGQDILNPNLNYIKEKFPKEYEMAQLLANRVAEVEKIVISEGEIGFITMYLNEMLQLQTVKERIGVIVLSHGKVASELLRVVNQMLNVNFPIAVDMPLNMNPIKLFEQVVDLCQQIKTEKGILFFADMGSLTGIGDIVFRRTGIRTRMIDRVDIVSVLEAVRKADATDETLDEIYYDIINVKYNYSRINKEVSDKPVALLTLCLTGHGVALKIQELLRNYYPDVTILALGLLEDGDIKQKIASLRCKYRIPAIIGTINPHIEGMNFIAFAGQDNTEQRMFLDYLLKQSNPSGLESMMKKDFILLDVESTNKMEILENMVKVLFDDGLVTMDYLHSVLKREKMNSTCFRHQLAIPHGLSAYVLQSAVVFARLKHAVSWDEQNHMVRLICLLAVRSEEAGVVTKLFHVLRDEEQVKRLLKTKTQQEFIDQICFWGQ